MSVLVHRKGFITKSRPINYQFRVEMNMFKTGLQIKGEENQK